MIELSPPALEILQKVSDHIRKEPRRFVMQVFGRSDDLAPCGTVACVAGWMVLLDGPMPRDADEFYAILQNAETKALRLLQLPDFADSNAIFPLFHTDAWPQEYGHLYEYMGDCRGTYDLG